MSDSSWSFSLNREEILRRKAGRDRMVEQITELQRQLEAEDKWFEAISIILPPALRATLGLNLAPSEANETRSEWRRAIEPVIMAATRGLLPREIAQGIRDGTDESAKERLARNPNGIYAALDRMIDDGQVVRHNDKIYSSALYEALSSDGEIEDDLDESGLSGVNGFIVEIVKDYGPCAPRNIMQALREDPNYKPKIEKNPQYGYSALARLARQGHLIKDGSLYALPSKKNEPNDAGASNGSDASASELKFT
ncbi:MULTISPECIES: hypothetical protein [unclassified Methylobacterium]|uniref:hypothetical protein n=1 Tax=unclassified Methylobacterium TaxID=2615210 RepID=UPI0036F7FC6F